MKKSFHIFQRDLSRLLHNKAAILVLIGVCLLPSLYAWFNIAANLDPYGNTSKIKVAIACLDKEASSENLSINAGKEIVKNLKERSGYHERIPYRRRGRSHGYRSPHQHRSRHGQRFPGGLCHPSHAGPDGKGSLQYRRSLLG